MPDASELYHAGTVNEQPPAEAALSYARAGYRIFPCRADKKPLVRWTEAATTDVVTIERWWKEWPEAMVGLPTGDGLVVVDLDVDKKTGEVAGEATAERLHLREAISSGLLARSQSGGLHAYFAGDAPTTSGRIGRGIDTRGSGGYIIAPGSRNATGQYRWLGRSLLETVPPALPDAIVAALNVSDKLADLRFEPGPDFVAVGEAGPSEVEEVLSWIDPDSGGYQQWCDVLMGLHDHFGGSDAGLRIADDWSRRGAKYRPGELPRKWQSFAAGGGITFGTICNLARRNGADLPAIYQRHRAPRVQCSGTTADPGEEEDGAAMPPMRFLDYDAMLAMPEPRWLVDGVLQERTAALMFGKSNTFKSFLAIDLALSLATGRPWHGASVRGGRVLYIATEGANGVGRIRIPGWYDAHEVPDAQRRNAFLWPREVSLDGEQSVDALIRSLNAEIYANGFTMVVADIFGGTMLGPETKAETARAWVAGVQGLIRDAGVTVLTVAHTGWADETRARMHTHFWGSFDTRLKVEGDKTTMETVLSVDRHKDADSRGTWGFRMILTHGSVGMGTLVPERADDVKVERRKRVSGKPQIALKALDDALVQYGMRRQMEGLPSCKVVSMNDWRKMCDLHSLSESDKEDARRQAFSRARSALQAKGEVRCCGDFVWRPSRKERDEL